MADIDSIVKSGAALGLVVCHDGSVFRFEVVGEPAEGYIINGSEEAAELFQKALGARMWKGEAEAFGAIERLCGVRIEHFA